jgi:hypothetical protein
MTKQRGNSHLPAVASFKRRLKPGRLSRPFALEVPASSDTPTT